MKWRVLVEVLLLVPVLVGIVPLVKDQNQSRCITIGLIVLTLVTLPVITEVILAAYVNDGSCLMS
ncbi:hypothetical protein FHS16_004139 [Paenibacillus endophyticus]|uniref:Uncharacterized protein n=1 Tax=Paenibacillus endophyticus TaxID=1294268 RepID=A0A7W5CAE4_9BACL|nr:hypothetical protein [Paenibacillus endophyticus]